MRDLCEQLTGNVFSPCLLDRFPECDRSHLETICPCFSCAGPPSHGRYGCILMPIENLSDHFTPPNYIMSPWEIDQIERLRASREFCKKQQDEDTDKRG